MQTKYRVYATNQKVTDDDILESRKRLNKERRRIKKNMKKVEGITLPTSSRLVDGELIIEKAVRKDFDHQSGRPFKEIKQRKLPYGWSRRNRSNRNYTHRIKD